MTNKEAFIWLDSMIGKHNLPINNGVIYIEQYRTLKDNHHFLIDHNFHNGDVEYDGQTYYNIPIKYDVFEDNLIVKIPSVNENYPLVLAKEKISAFYLNSNSFINTKENGFMSQLSKYKDFILYKKYFKKRLSKTSTRFSYHKFIPENTYFIGKNDVYTNINKKKYWLQLFPNKKNIIRGYFKENAQKLEHKPDAFMIELLKKCMN
ncbi:hypothetical protein [Polaribacter sp.]|uniref:hypothetical protein n=1 Tax=Polaribacter sp. TaxID=1920175 RepID=UPI003EF9619A